LIRALLVFLAATLVVGCGSAERSDRAGADQGEQAARVIPKSAGDKSVPDFSDYPAKVLAGPLRFPKEDKWPDPNWRQNAASGINFGGHFTHVIMNCGIACTSDWIVDRRNGQMIRAPGGGVDVEPESTETRPDSNLMKIVWVSSRNDGTGETFAPCSKQDFVWTDKGFRALAKRVETTCPPEVTG
jgi:hypothetical protein